MPTYRNIWAGCYDVWYDEKDRIAQREIPRYRTQQMIEKGLIYKENITRVYGGEFDEIKSFSTIKSIYKFSDLCLPQKLKLEKFEKAYDFLKRSG